MGEQEEEGGAEGSQGWLRVLQEVPCVPWPRPLGLGLGCDAGKVWRQVLRGAQGRGQGEAELEGLGKAGGMGIPACFRAQQTWGLEPEFVGSGVLGAIKASGKGDLQLFVITSHHQNRAGQL